MIAERHDAVLRRLELFRALAEENEREQQLGSFTYAYPQSLGESLGTAVQLAGSVSWQAHYALRPLLTQGDHERLIAGQGRGMIELYGAVLVGALGACHAALEREVATELEVELPDLDSVVDVWDEARDERDGLMFSLARLARRSRSTAPAATETPRCCQPSRRSCLRRRALRGSRSRSPTRCDIGGRRRSRRTHAPAHQRSCGRRQRPVARGPSERAIVIAHVPIWRSRRAAGGVSPAPTRRTRSSAEHARGPDGCRSHSESTSRQPSRPEF